jgi:hypothetical protein
MPKTTTPAEFLKRAENVHGDKYEYSKVVFVKMSDMLTIICPIHGAFDQRASVHINDGCGCPRCGKLNRGVKITTDQFVDAARAIHGDKYVYTNTEYVNAHTDVVIDCREHGAFFQRPDAHVHQKQGCRQCGYGNRVNPLCGEYVGLAVQKWGDRYDYSETEYVDKGTKIVYVCGEHGKVEQSPHLHLRSGCPYCNGRGISRHTVQTFVNIAGKVHGDVYDYSRVKLNRITDYVDIVCVKHGVFVQRANNHVHLGNGCPKCVGSVSVAEKEVLAYIRGIYSGVVEENDRVVLLGKEMDVYVPGRGFGVEYHGMYWHMETIVGRRHHYDKANLADAAGIQLVQVYEDEWRDKRGIVESKLKNLLGLSSRRIMARKCVVGRLGSGEKSEFLDRTHIQGRDGSTVAYGLYFGDELVSCMSFGRSRFNKGFRYELIRCSSLQDTVVVGGAARLLSVFRKENVGSIISYADRRWSCGNLYKKLGFRLDGLTKPSFSYYHLGEKKIYSRLKFQKHKLSGMPGYSPDLKEYEIMQLNGYDRIWDAGQYRFVLD